jgi:hypothetical protein
VTERGHAKVNGESYRGGLSSAHRTAAGADAQCNDIGGGLTVRRPLGFPLTVLFLLTSCPRPPRQRERYSQTGQVNPPRVMSSTTLSRQTLCDRERVMCTPERKHERQRRHPRRAADARRPRLRPLPTVASER